MAYARGEIIEWLDELAAGELHLDDDNMGMAAAAIDLLLGGQEPAPLPDDHLSPHFALAEFTDSDTALAQGIDNTPTAAALKQLADLALMMEKVRTLCGSNPVLISSGYRCPELNKAVGGATNSAHLYGCACDFIIPEFGSVLDVCHRLAPCLVGLGIDQLINESGGGASWVHIGRAIPPSLEPRHQRLTIDSAGTRTGFA